MDNINPKVRIIKNFISKDECDWLIDYANTINLWPKANRSRSMFKTEKEYLSHAEHWDNRRIEINTLYEEGMDKHLDLFKKVVPIQSRMKEEVLDFFNPDFNLFSELWEIVKWEYPNLQYPHIDFIDPDFDESLVDINTVPEDCRYFFDPQNIAEYKRLFTNKIYTSMLYLNDDFEGGELFFPQHDFTIKPEAGMLLVFSGSIENMHGIKQIQSGTRYTHTTFWTKDMYKSSRVAIDHFRNKFPHEKLVD